MVAAAKNMADLMIQMSEFNRSVLQYVMFIDSLYSDKKEEFIDRSHDIVRESKLIVKMANKVCEAASDHKGLKTVSLSNMGFIAIYNLRHLYK